MVNYKNLFNSMGIVWPKKLLFIGSGITETPADWMNIQSIRVNARTIGRFPENKIHSIITWPTPAHVGRDKAEGFRGVEKSTQRNLVYNTNIIVFDLKRDEGISKVGSNVTIVGTKNKFEDVSFKSYVDISSRFKYSPRNSTGFYIILWLLYADVDEIYISGYDGYKALTGLVPGEWDVSTPYHYLDGDVWVEQDNEDIKNNNIRNYNYHNLTTEWLAIEEAIKIAEERGVKVFVAKDNDEL